MRRKTLPLPAAAAVLVLVASAVAIAVARDLPGDSLGVRRFLTPEITGSTRVGQSFTMTSSGLHAIAIHPDVVGSLRGKVRVELSAFKDGRAMLIRSAEVDVRDLVADDAFLFRFDPVTDPGYARYILEVSPSAGAASGGIALWATKGERLSKATLSFNGIKRWGDLAFQTYARASDADGRWSRQDFATRRRWLALGGLLVSWLAVGVVLRQAASPSPTMCQRS
jgi:hypothetical protein